MSEPTMGQVPTPDGQAPQDLNTAPAGTNGQEPKVFDEAYVKTLRQEAAQWRKQAQEAAAKVQTFEQQQMSEAEKLQAAAKSAQEQAQAAQAELRKARADAAIAMAAATHGVSPKLAAKLVAVEFDADGQPINVDRALGAVLNEYPQLKPVAGTVTPGATNPQRQSKLTMEQIKKMSPAEINARWDEVQQALQGG